MQTALNQAGYDLTAQPERAPGEQYSGAWVTDDKRHVSTHLAIGERWFLMEFWERGVRMAHGKTTDLLAAAGSTGLWQSGATLRDLQATWPFVKYGDLAEAYEQGNPVEVKWMGLRQNTSENDRDLIEAVYAQPRLRTLFPFTSHRALLLSRCTRYPFAADLPVIVPLTTGRYKVIWPSGSPYGSGEIDEVGSSADAAAIVAAHLPADYGPAIDGTADDLDR
jgi:hypothetical protein